MSSISTNIHTLFPGARQKGYFDEDNICFLQKAVAEQLSKEFRQKVKYDRASVIRVMGRIHEERPESIPRMNQRVIMSLCAEYRRYQARLNKRMCWEENFFNSQQLVDPTGQVGPDTTAIRGMIKNRYGVPQNGGSLRFYFT
jgi:restriction endonuclease